MKHALKLPLDDYEATKTMLEGVLAQLAYWCSVFLNPIPHVLTLQLLGAMHASCQCSIPILLPHWHSFCLSGTATLRRVSLLVVICNSKVMLPAVQLTLRAKAIGTSGKFRHGASGSR